MFSPPYFLPLHTGRCDMTELLFWLANKLGYLQDVCIELAFRIERKTCQY
jgi:hypothetical protein